MIVYVEANFILELVALQEEYDACSGILELAESSACSLVVPAFAVAEPFDVIRRRAADRRRLNDELSRHLRLLSRTGSYEEQLRHAADVAALLIESAQMETERLHTVLSRVLGVAEVIPISAETLQRALDAQST